MSHRIWGYFKIVCHIDKKLEMCLALFWWSFLIEKRLNFKAQSSFCVYLVLFSCISCYNLELQSNSKYAILKKLMVQVTNWVSNTLSMILYKVILHIDHISLKKIVQLMVFSKFPLEFHMSRRNEKNIKSFSLESVSILQCSNIAKVSHKHLNSSQINF